MKRRGREVSGNDTAGLAELRRIVVGPEQVRLEQLEERPVASADTIGDVLPEAVVRASTTREQVLAIALEPAMTTALRAVVHKDADFFGKLLAPTIGAAVRKAVSEALKAMLQKFNETLERSMSIRSLQWRIEARRTGTPFAEVVLLRTLIYRVEQVFLIHPTTGVVLLHLAEESHAVQDPDQVASMLEAIDSFVREAFRPQPPGVHLNQVAVGDLTVWVDRDPSLAVAAVVRGVAPRELADCLYEVRERVRLAYQTELELFRSDVSQFAPARPLLEPVLRSERRAPPRRAQLWIIVIVAAIAVLLGLLIARAVQHARLLRTYVELLQAEPGIVVTSAERSGAHLRIEGLRDPLAAAPTDVLERHGLTAPELSFAPFLSLDPQLVELRARQQSRPPADVTLQVRQALQAEQAKREALAAAARALETTVLHFISGSAELTPDTNIENARARWHELLTAADAAGLPICVAIVGHADPVGSQRTNQMLSEARAAHAARTLISTTDDARIRVVGAGVLHDAESLEQARSVTFQVDVGTGCPGRDGTSDDD